MAEAGPLLRRALGVWDGVAVFVGIILGSGIFVAPAVVAKAAPGAFAATSLWLAGGVVMLAGASCYAECGARLPQTGGFYVFYREAYGASFAFVAGWAALAITYPASIAGIALVFAHYLGDALGLSLGSTATSVAAAAAVGVAGAFNAAGVRAGAGAQRLLTAVKVTALLALCVAAVVGQGSASATAAAGSPPAVGLTGFTMALVLVMWTYDGWTDVTLLSGELANPGRTLGRVVMIGAAVLVATYVAVQLAVLSLLGPGQAAGSERVLADAVERGLGTGAGRLVACLVVVSTFGSINGIVMAASRLGFAMARDRVFPAWFGAVHQRLHTPARSTLALVAATLLYVLASNFQGLLALFTFSVWIFYSLVAIALLRLRRRGVGEPVRFRAFGGLVSPLLVVACGLWMTTSLFAEDPWHSATGAGLLGFGFLLYHAIAYVRRRTATSAISS